MSLQTERAIASRRKARAVAVARSVDRGQYIQAAALSLIGATIVIAAIAAHV